MIQTHERPQVCTRRDIYAIISQSSHAQMVSTFQSPVVSTLRVRLPQLLPRAAFDAISRRSFVQAIRTVLPMQGISR